MCRRRQKPMSSGSMRYVSRSQNGDPRRGRGIGLGEFGRKRLDGGGHKYKPGESQERGWIIWKKVCSFPNPGKYKEDWQSIQCTSSWSTSVPFFLLGTYFLPSSHLNSESLESMILAWEQWAAAEEAPSALVTSFPESTQLLPSSLLLFALINVATITSNSS